MSYIDELIENCKLGKKAVPIREFELKELSDLDDIEKAIYIIEEVDGQSEKTFIEFSVYKKSRERSCSKLNSPSAVMYVGSSTAGVKK